MWNIKKNKSVLTEALVEKLDVQTLGDRCKTSRRNLQLRLISSEENHDPIIDWLIIRQTTGDNNPSLQISRAPSISVFSVQYYET